MRLETLLNHVEKYKSFVYQKAKLTEDKGATQLEVEMRPRKNSKPICSKCHKPGPCYDHQPKPRRFEHVPFWGLSVVLLYVMRRVDCVSCGVTTEEVPWAVGKCQQTRSMKLFLATWARRLAWEEVSQIFRTPWGRIRDAVEWVVEYGLQHRDLAGITAIGIDEVHAGKGQGYLTVVYQINEGMKRLLYVGRARTRESLLTFFREFGVARSHAIKYVCSDMWAPYLAVVKAKAKNALNVLDRFHIAKKLNEAINEVRAQEARAMKEQGYEEVLKHSRYCFLKNAENLTYKQQLKLEDVLQYDLKTVRAYLLKEGFQCFWSYVSPYWANWFLKKWCARAMRSQLKPMKRFVGTLRSHQPLLMNWFKARKAYSSGAVEGLNRKINLVTRKSYGFREYSTLRLALFHTLGSLPEPECTHRYC
jgi:transposase